MDPLEVECQVLGRLIAFLPILRQALVKNVLKLRNEIRRSPDPRRVERGRRLFENRAQSLRGALPQKRTLTAQHLLENDAQSK
jgi:hypothetical protein